MKTSIYVPDNLAAEAKARGISLSQVAVRALKTELSTDHEGTPMTTTTETTPTFDEWAIVELLGHRRLAGRIREVQIAGHGFLRLDIPDTGDEKTWEPGATQFISPGSVYALHPVDEDTARRAAGLWRPEPVSRWQLEPPAKPSEGRDLDYDGDGPF